MGFWNPVCLKTRNMRVWKPQKVGVWKPSGRPEETIWKPPNKVGVWKSLWKRERWVSGEPWKPADCRITGNNVRNYLLISG
jgi:hypothetical protein